MNDLQLLATAAEDDLELRAASSMLMERIAWMRRAGISFKGDRDLYEILGYSRILTGRDYRDRYARGGIAKRIVDAFPDATWRGEMWVEENDTPESDTPFEDAWNALDARLSLRAKMHRVDKLSQLSMYAVLLIGAPGDYSTELPRAKSPDDLIFLTPFSGGGGPGIGPGNRMISDLDADATIQSYDVDPTSPRFGTPFMYQLRRTDIVSPDLQRPIHWTRIIHVADGCLDNEIYGQPALESVWNLLDDLDKVTGGGAESYWLRAKAGLHFNVDKTMGLTTGVPTPGQPPSTGLNVAERDKLKANIENYQHQLTDHIITRGVDVTELGTTNAAPFNAGADAILTQIAGAKAIPKRILTGSEMGELASSQDRDNWKDQINGRQTGYVGPAIVRQLVDRLVAYGYLPEPTKGPTAYVVKWPHIQTLTEAEKAEGAKNWATVNSTQGAVVFTENEIREKWYGMAPLTDEEAADGLSELDKASGALRWSMVNKGSKDIVFTPDEIRDRWEKMPPLTDEQRAIAVENAKAFTEATAGPGAGGAPGAAGGDVGGGASGGGGMGAALGNNPADSMKDSTAAGVRAAAWFGSRVRALLSGGHSYASTQVELSPTIAEKMRAFTNAIPTTSLAPDGIETDAHVTVKYGLHTNNADDVRDVIADVGPAFVTLGPLGVFTADDYDVLYVTVTSPDLVAMNARLSAALPVTDTHPTYQPHATLAYLKSGHGGQYAGRTDFAGLTDTITSMRYSTPDDVITDIELPSLSSTLRAYADVEQEMLAVLSEAIMANNTAVIDKIIGARLSDLGGAKSGNFGHAGRKGEVGGSAPGGNGGGKSAVIEHEFLATPSDALISLINGEHATVAPEDVRSVLQKAQETKGPAIDLTKLTVEGTPIFAGGLNRPRLTMPQIPKEHQEAFFNSLKDQGIAVLRETVAPSSLLPTQNEINAAKVGEMLGRKKDMREVMISKDNYVLDGHHRWATAATLDVESPNAHVKMPVFRIMADHSRALSAMTYFTKTQGIVNKALQQSAWRRFLRLSPKLDLDDD